MTVYRDMKPADFALAGMAIASVLGDVQGWQALAEKAALDMYRLRAGLIVSGAADAVALYDCMVVALAETGAVWNNARVSGLTDARKN